RQGEVDVLTRHFLDDLARAHDGVHKRLTGEGVTAMRRHTWPGNVRELKNVIERAYVLSGVAREIGREHLLIQRRVARATLASRAEVVGEIEIPFTGKTLTEIEQEAVELTLQATGGNQSRAAK